MAVVTLKKVVKYYDETLAVRGIDLEIADEEFLVLVGPSGCGKTTTLRMIAGLEEISDGEILIGDEVVNDVPPKDRNIAMVFQNFNLFPHMSVIDQITLAPVKAHGISKAEAVEEGRALLARFGLGDREKDYPDQLSGGQQQRVALIRAIATRPRALLLDEITSALDPELVGEVLEVVRELKVGGMTMLIATHEMAFARDVADEVCFLHQGQVLERGAARDVIDNPQQAETQRFLSRMNAARVI